jgi:hypothetical protein
MNSRKSLSLLLVVCLFSLAAHAKMKANYDKKANFTGYKTYAWVECVKLARQGANIVIGNGIDYQLQARGLQKTDIEHADLLVRFQAASDTDLNFARSSDPLYSQFGGIPLPDSYVWGVGFNIPTSGRYVKQGNLVIDVFDKSKHMLIWTCLAEENIFSQTNKAIVQVDQIIGKMFQEYPVKPQSSGGD